MIFKYDGDSIIVDVAAIEVYIPYDFVDMGLVQTVGQETRMFGLYNFRVFKSESQLKERNKLKAHPCSISAFFNTKPSEKDIDEISVLEGQTPEKTLILRYYKGDVFVVDGNVIKNVDNTSITLSLIDAGKYQNHIYEVIPDSVDKAQKMNGTSLRVPRESIDTLVAERYRDPKNYNVKARHMKTKPEAVVSVTPREGAATTSTFSMITFEDINSAVLIAHNRHKEGVQDDESILEKIIKGEDVPYDDNVEEVHNEP